jgi:hypothetical protein
VTGEGSLDDLASLPNAPHTTTIKKRASAEDWTEQRRAFRHQTTTKVREIATTTEADVSARHVKIAQALQAKALQALQKLDVDKLPPSEIRQFLATATDIERKALGMDNKFTLKGVGNLDQLSDADLLTLARRAGVLGDSETGGLTA